MPAILLVLLAAAGPAGTLAGKVSLSGLAPKLANLPVTRDTKTCGTTKPDESLEVGSGGGLKNAVLWFTDLPAEKDSKPPRLKLDQQGCVFVPHVLAAPLGATLDVVNSDKALHNVRAQAGETRLFNYAMPIQGHVVPTRVKKDGIFKLSCDVHPWMRGWLLVLTSAHFAVTDENGAYKIEGVPAGKHKLKAWHERLGEREAEIEIKAGQTAAHDVAYNPR